MKRLILILSVVLLSSCNRNAWKKQQDQLSYKNYKSNFKKEMIRDARFIGKQKKTAKRDSIKQVRFFAKILRLKNNK